MSEKQTFRKRIVLSLMPSGQWEAVYEVSPGEGPVTVPEVNRAMRMLRVSQRREVGRYRKSQNAAVAAGVKNG